MVQESILKQWLYCKVNAQQAFTCSEALETLETGVEYVQS